MAKKNKKTFIDQRITVDDKKFNIKITDISNKRTKYFYVVKPLNEDKEVTEYFTHILNKNEIVDFVKKSFSV